MLCNQTRASLLATDSESIVVWPKYLLIHLEFDRGMSRKSLEFSNSPCVFVPSHALTRPEGN